MKEGDWDWYIYTSKNFVIIGSDNGLSPLWWQAIMWTNDDMLSIEPFGKNFNEIWIKIKIFSFQNGAFEPLMA